jgi:hypothetical protein
VNEKRIAELREQIAPLQNEIWEIEQAERTAKVAALIGKCFVYSNSYSGDDQWPLYQKVIQSGDKFFAVGAQYDRRGSVEVRCKELFVFSGTETLGHEISETEYRDGIRACMERAQRFLNGEVPAPESE